MPPIDTPPQPPWRPDPQRRTVLAATLAAPALLIPRRLSAASGLAPTPRQSEGPFYPRTPPTDSDADLSIFEGQRAPGDVIEMAGRVFRTTGTPVLGAIVEIWHCDPAGRYAHVGVATDPAFQGYGAVRTGADGAYRFRTTRPGLYPGRTRHIHVAVRAPQGAGLTTQMYFPGEPGNASDGLLRRTPRSASLIAIAEPGPPTRYLFDIVLA